MLALGAFFTVLTIVEIWLLLAIGSILGFWPTLAITIGTALLGGYLAKREGLRVLHAWRKAVAEMRAPREGVLSGVLVLAGGLFLATPGVLTDVIGLALLFPPTRRVIARLLKRYFEHRFEKRIAASAAGGSGFRVVHFSSSWSPNASERSGRAPRGDVIDVEGEVVEERAERVLGPRPADAS